MTTIAQCRHMRRRLKARWHQCQAVAAAGDGTC
jgi:hypothetical protein